MELGEGESRLQKKMTEVQTAAAQATRDLELRCASQKKTMDQQRQLHEADMQKALKETERLTEKMEKLQEEKNDVFRLLAEKEKEIESITKAADHYKYKFFFYIFPLVSLINY